MIPATFASCLNDSPVAVTDARIRATLSANVVAATAGGTVGIRVGYRTSRQQLVVLRSSPERVQVAPATTLVLPLTVDIGPCLADPERVPLEQSGCALVIELTLSDASGETIDSQTRDAREPVVPGESVDFGTVTIGVPPAPLPIQQRPATGCVLTGQTVTLEVTSPPGAVTWVSSNTGVATVGTSTGVVSGIAAGQATITATSGSRTGTLSLCVAGPLRVQPTSLALTAGRTSQITTLGASGGTLTFASNATSVATVDASGLVRGVGIGSATITATLTGGSGTQTATTSVSVSAANLVINPTAASAAIGRTTRFTAAALDANGATIPNVSVNWAISDATVGTLSATAGPTVDVRALKLGTTSLRATLGSLIASAAFTGIAAPVAVRLEKVSGDGAVCLTRSTGCTFVVRAVDAEGLATPGARIDWSSNATCGPPRVAVSDDNGLASSTNICSSVPTGPYTQLASLQSNQQQASFTFTLRGVRVVLQGYDNAGAAIFAITTPDGSLASGLTAAVEYKSGPISNYVSRLELNRTTTPATLTMHYYNGQMPYGDYVLDLVVSTTTPGLGPGVERFVFTNDYYGYSVTSVPNASRVRVSGSGSDH